MPPTTRGMRKGLKMGFEQSILQKMLEYGLAGVVMGFVMWAVVRPLLNGMMEQLRMAREDRITQCERHADYHQNSTEILTGLAASVDSLVRRANGK